MEVKDNIFEEKGLWYYRYKTITNQFAIEMKTGGPCDDEEEAQLRYRLAEKKYQKKMTELRGNTGMRYTLSEYLTYWVDEIFAPISKGKSTHFTSCWAVNALILPAIKTDYIIGMVTADELNEIIANVVDEKKTLQLTAYKYLKRAMLDAYRYGYLMKDVTSGMIRPHGDSEPNIRILKQDEITSLLKAASTHDSFLEIILALFCGMRGGEIRGLKFSDCDRETRTIYIQRQIVSSVENLECSDGVVHGNSTAVEKDPKTRNSIRKIKVPEFVFDELDKRKAYNKTLNLKKDLEDYVSVSDQGQIKNVHTVPHDLDRICTEARISPKVTMHGLRHMAATLLLESGMELEDISRFLGHHSIRTTFGIYCAVINSDEKIRSLLEDEICPYEKMDKKVLKNAM